MNKLEMKGEQKEWLGHLLIRQVEVISCLYLERKKPEYEEISCNKRSEKIFHISPRVYRLHWDGLTFLKKRGCHFYFVWIPFSLSHFLWIFFRFPFADIECKATPARAAALQQS